MYPAYTAHHSISAGLAALLPVPFLCLCWPWMLVASSRQLTLQRLIHTLYLWNLFCHPSALHCTAGGPADAGSQGGAGGGAAAPRQTYFEAMRSFLLTHLLSDTDMEAEMQAGRGAAHFDVQQYKVREVLGLKWAWAFSSSSSGMLLYKGCSTRTVTCRSRL